MMDVALSREKEGKGGRKGGWLPMSSGEEWTKEVSCYFLVELNGGYTLHFTYI